MGFGAHVSMGCCSPRLVLYFWSPKGNLSWIQVTIKRTHLESFETSRLIQMWDKKHHFRKFLSDPDGNSTPDPQNTQMYLIADVTSSFCFDKHFAGLSISTADVCYKRRVTTEDKSLWRSSKIKLKKAAAPGEGSIHAIKHQWIRPGCLHPQTF